MIEGLNLQQFYSYSGCDEVHHEMKIEALGTFTAYTNRCVKVRFEDRTVLRMKQGSEHIRILNAKGEEMTINLNGVARNYSLLKDYQNYIKVAHEFLDWVYLTKEEK